MTSSQRVALNTGAQYIKTIINMVLSLYIIRIVLQVLGAEDFGLYSLIAGVIAMLSFLTNAMVATTQRFVSFYQGKGDLCKLKNVFNSSLCIHIGLGLITVVILECVTPFLFNGFLNIPAYRYNAAVFVYQITVLIILLTFSTAPYRALLVSHENIIYISLVDVLDGVVKLFLVLFISLVHIDRLMYYSLVMLLVQVFDFFAIAIYCHIKYRETTYPNPFKIDCKILKDLGAFAGWTLYSSGCVIGRQHGIAIVLNRLMGATVNAAYGIGFQVAGYTNFLAQSLVNSITPQIVKAEASGDRKRALWLSNLTSKFIFYLLSILCIPCMFEINTILSLWLEKVPQYTSLFCIMVMLTLLVDSVSIGLTYINQAIGNIKWYSIFMYTPKLFTLPLFYICLKCGGDLKLAAGVYIAIELFCSILRIPFLKKTAGLDVKEFGRQVVISEVATIIILVISCILITAIIPSSLFRLIITFVIPNALFFIAIWFWGVDNHEREIIKAILIKVYKI